MAPNAKSAPHIGGGHFQWTKSEPLSKILIDFIKGNFMIHLYTASTPNGHKVSCLLEALECLTVHSVNLAEGEQKNLNF